MVINIVLLQIWDYVLLLCVNILRLIVMIRYEVILHLIYPIVNRFVIHKFIYCAVSVCHVIRIYHAFLLIRQN